MAFAFLCCFCATFVHAQTTPLAGARFLEQSTFGAKPSDLAHIQDVGVNRFLAEQFTATPSVFDDIPVVQNQTTSLTPFQSRFYNNAVNQPDQLRQRVAFALSQIWVVSNNKIGDGNAMTVYYRLLMQHALGNYYNLMYDMTLNPAMGRYLDMVNNDKPNPARGYAPNENYAREILQLFTIGLNELNDDGTEKLDGTGTPIPSYDQDEIEGFAHLFTGWTYPAKTGVTSKWTNPTNYLAPMVSFDAHHDLAQKQLLEGFKTPANLTAQQDLELGLKQIFNNHNLPPFVCKNLIQHLTTSNPSKEYVGRCTQIFKSNAAGVRGDMKSVVKQILTDPEARQNDTGLVNSRFGHLREPALFITAMARGLNATVPDNNTLNNESANQSQNILNSPTVFNYYSPFYKATDTLLGPEFELFDPATAVNRSNFVWNWIFNGTQTRQAASFDLTPWTTLAADPNKLVDQINAQFFRGTMQSATRASILKSLTSQTTPKAKAQAALYLALTSQDFQVIY